MAACPYSKVEGASWFKNAQVYCTSPSNPPNSRGGATQDGVDWGRCVEGKSDGIKFTQCCYCPPELTKNKSH